MKNQELITCLHTDKSLSQAEWEQLISTYSEEDAAMAAQLACQISTSVFSKQVYIRGIIEFSNYCKNNCYYCGIRHDNTYAVRYRLTEDVILDCCADGYQAGLRTFVLQSGEDPYFTEDRMVHIIQSIHTRYPDCAITLSLGEKSYESYERFYQAGACRYLLRHETADATHYAKLHPKDQTYDNRMRCLYDLKKIGYQTGCGFMVGSPDQTSACLAKDMMFLQKFRPEMIGIGPFLHQKNTPFHNKPNGSLTLTLFLLSLCRILYPNVLLPATTALGTLHSKGRELGILAGCNVIMPNLSPKTVRDKYTLYDNKIYSRGSTNETVKQLAEQMQSIGYTIVEGRGDYQGGNHHD